MPGSLCQHQGNKLQFFFLCVPHSHHLTARLLTSAGLVGGMLYLGPWRSTWRQARFLPIGLAHLHVPRGEGRKFKVHRDAIYVCIDRHAHEAGLTTRAVSHPRRVGAQVAVETMDSKHLRHDRYVLCSPTPTRTTFVHSSTEGTCWQTDHPTLQEHTWS